MSNLLDTGTDTDDRSPARPRHVPAELEFKDCDPRQACRHSSFYEEVSTTSAEFTKDSSLIIEDSFLDQSNDIPNSHARKVNYGKVSEATHKLLDTIATSRVRVALPKAAAAR